MQTFLSEITEEAGRDPWKCSGCICRTNLCHAHIWCDPPLQVTSKRTHTYHSGQVTKLFESALGGCRWNAVTAVSCKMRSCSASHPSLVDGREEGLLREGSSFPAQGLLVTLGLPVWWMPVVNDMYQQTHRNTCQCAWSGEGCGDKGALLWSMSCRGLALFTRSVFVNG